MASKSKLALGKGLAALIPNGASGLESAMGLPGDPFSAEDGARVHNTSIEKIVPSPFQPRNRFTEEQLSELVNSIKEHGIIQPLIVRQVGDKLELIAGERRWRASRALEIKEVPVIIRKATDRDVLEWALVENLQREDLNPIEEAAGYARLAKEFKLKQDQIAARVGKSRVSIANAIRLLDLNNDVQELLSQGKLSVGHAKAILSVKNKEAQWTLAQEVMRKSLTVRQVEKAAKNITQPSPRADKHLQENSKSQDILHLESHLTKIFQSRVAVSQQSGTAKGKLEIHFSSIEEFRHILELLGVEMNHETSV